MRNDKGQFVKGHPVSEKTKEAVSARQKGNTHRRGSRHTDEAKEKNRLAHIGKVTMSGKSHTNWKGGITPLRKKLYFSVGLNTVFHRISAGTATIDAAACAFLIASMRNVRVGRGVFG